MLAAGRRVSLRTHRQATKATPTVLRVLRSCGADSTGAVAPALERTVLMQRRSFFGLREMLFGHKPKQPDQQQQEQTATEKKTTESLHQPTIVTATAKNNVDSDVTAPVPEKLVGSLDETHFSVGKYARLADGGVLATCGNTMLLTTVVSDAGGSNKRSRDFLPLMVDYRVKYYATGMIPDTAKRTEFSGTDEEILQSRVVDRVIRPLFPRDFYDDTQLIATVQSFDPNNDALVVAINSASAALSVSNIPWNGPVGAVRVIELDGQLIANPTLAQRELATLELLYAATETRTLMIEAAGDEISEERMAEALEFAHAAISPIIEHQKQLVKQHGKPKRTYHRTVVSQEVMDKAMELGLEEANTVLGTAKSTKVERQEGEKHVYGKIISGLREHFRERNDIDDSQFQMAAHDVFQRALREKILAGDKNHRYDGRLAHTIRALNVETDVLPMAHGSSVFTRGDTQALCSVTLGPLDRGLRIRSALNDPTKLGNDAPMKHAMLHYEFPPYCVNETGRLGGMNRRMIGHGALAEKAILPVLPSIDDFPYTVRMTSEIMGSDGSSSMATVCGVSLALMDAGVPMKAPVAGISIGLITDGDPFDGEKEIHNYRLITDILGTEDHYGDMDFKIAGTDTGITAIQLDVKLPGVPLDILCRGMHHAKKARTNILRKMNGTISEPRKTLKAAGLITNELNVTVEFTIPVGSIGILIGTGGANIRELEQTHQCTVSIDRKAGVIRVVATPENAEAAKNAILQQAGPKASSFFRKGEKYTMRVTEVMDFGAILESTAPTKNRGFVHITELAHGRVENIHSLVSVGQEMEFECIQEGISGKMSRKALLAAVAAPHVTPANNAADFSAPASPSPKRPSAQSLGGKRRSKTSVAGKPGHARGAAHRRAASPSRSDASSS